MMTKLIRKPTDYMLEQIQDDIVDHGYNWHTNGKQSGDPALEVYGECVDCGVRGEEDVYSFDHDDRCKVAKAQAWLDEVNG
jgi:hypothetical protein